MLVDKIDLSLPNPEHESDVYEAEYAELEGAAPVYGYDSGASIPKGATATFWAYSPADAAALLDLGDGKVQLEINGESVTTAKNGTVDAFLLGGVNKIVVKGAKGLQIDRLTVGPVRSARLPGLSRPRTARSPGPPPPRTSPSPPAARPSPASAANRATATRSPSTPSKPPSPGVTR